MNRLAQLVHADGKRIFRDPFLLMMVTMPVFFGLLLRNLLPWLRQSFITSFDLADYYPLIVSLFVATPAMYLGAVLALQLIEEQEAGMISAIRVTPFTLRRYVSLRLGGYTIFAAVLIFAVQLLIGIATPSLFRAALLALVFALQVPILALAIAWYSNNQLEGMVALKVSGLTLLPAMAMFFVSDYWHLWAGFLPAYWPIMAYFVALRSPPADGFFAFTVVVGLVYQSVLALWLFSCYQRKFDRAV